MRECEKCGQLFKDDAGEGVCPLCGGKVVKLAKKPENKPEKKPPLENGQCARCGRKLVVGKDGLCRYCDKESPPPEVDEGDKTKCPACGHEF